jgi:NAD(P)H-dependent FMN reductase
MNLLVVTGSHRIQSESKRIADLLIEKYFSEKFDNVYFHELSKMNIPFWNEGVWSKSEEWNFLKDIQLQQADTDAILFIVPEWGGMVPPMLKNYLLLSRGLHVGNKPALIISISSSEGGSHPVNELRISGYKNTKICFLPDHVIIRDCESFLKDDFKNEELLDRIDFCSGLLLAYAEGLKEVRNKKLDFEKYKYGM